MEAIINEVAMRSVPCVEIRCCSSRTMGQALAKDALFAFARLGGGLVGHQGSGALKNGSEICHVGWRRSKNSALNIAHEITTSRSFARRV